MVDRDEGRSKVFAKALPLDIERRKDSELSQNFEFHPLDPYPKKWSIRSSIESAQKDGLDLSRNPYIGDQENKSVSNGDLVGFDLSGDHGSSHPERDQMALSTDVIGLDMQAINRNPLDPQNFRIKPNRRRKPTLPPSRSIRKRGSVMSDLSPQRRFIPFFFLLLAVFTYFYIIMRVQLDIDLPEFMPLDVSNVSLFLALILILLLTIISNQIWRFYLIKIYYKKVGNGGPEGQ